MGSPYRVSTTEVGFIKLKKNFEVLIADKELIKFVLVYTNSPNNIVFRKGEYQLQLIDTVYPLFHFLNLPKLKI